MSASHSLFCNLGSHGCRSWTAGDAPGIGGKDAQGDSSDKLVFEAQEHEEFGVSMEHVDVRSVMVNSGAKGV